MGFVVSVLRAQGVQVFEEYWARRNDQGSLLETAFEPCCEVEFFCGSKVDGDRLALSVSHCCVFDGFFSDSGCVHGDALSSVALHHAVESLVLLSKGDSFVGLDFAQPVFFVVFFESDGDPVVVSSGDVVSDEDGSSLEEVWSSRLVVLRVFDEVACKPFGTSVLPVEFELLLPQAFVERIFSERFDVSRQSLLDGLKDVDSMLGPSFRLVLHESEEHVVAAVRG